jgi:hypothetical protein
MNAKLYEVIVDIEEDPDKPRRYARLSHKDRTEWKTKRIAQKHAREYKARHLRDSWVSEV